MTDISLISTCYYDMKKETGSFFIKRSRNLRLKLYIFKTLPVFLSVMLAVHPLRGALVNFYNFEAKLELHNA